MEIEREGQRESERARERERGIGIEKTVQPKRDESQTEKAKTNL